MKSNRVNKTTITKFIILVQDYCDYRSKILSAADQAVKDWGLTKIHTRLTKVKPKNRAER